MCARAPLTISKLLLLLSMAFGDDDGDGDADLGDA